MNKKIAFVSELGIKGKIPRNFQDMRTELAWMCALDAEHLPLDGDFEFVNKYDLIILIIPKNTNFNILLNKIFSIKSCGKKFAIMQEGPNWYYQDYNIFDQQIYIDILHKADFLLCHNDKDLLYYNGLLSSLNDKKRIHVLKSLMIEDSLVTPTKDKENKVIIGGNFVSWYGGFDSFSIALNFKVPIFAPTMGRTQKLEFNITRLNHIPYTNWVDWIKKINTFKYAVHLMRTHAAGTFSLNAAYLGIPCIGYEDLDTQRELFPELSVSDGNLQYAEFLAIKLKNNKCFYDRCSRTARNNYELMYHEDIFVNNFNSILDIEGV